MGKVMPEIEELASAWNEAIAEHDACLYRTSAGLAGAPSEYEIKLAGALNHLEEWARAGKFKPHNEEDVQCFLYHCLVLQFADATRIRTKRTLGSPGVRVENETVGGMHFPDLIIGDADDDPDAVYLELKVRAQGRKAFHQACLADVKKLAKHHSSHRQFFILYDCDPKVVYMSAAQSRQLHDATGKGCTVWHYPRELNEDVRKIAAAKAIATSISKGIDLKALAKSNAKKAALTKLAKAKAALAGATVGVAPSSMPGTESATASSQKRPAAQQLRPRKTPGSKASKADGSRLTGPKGASWR